jgi:hypothetical protein
MSEEIDYDRRRLLGSAATIAAAAQLGMIASAKAQSSKANPPDLPAIKPGTNTSFGSLKQIDAGVLNEMSRSRSGNRTWPSRILRMPYSLLAKTTPSAAPTRPTNWISLSVSPNVQAKTPKWRGPDKRPERVGLPVMMASPLRRAAKHQAAR